ncbi:hypothetical protein ACVJBD_005385 [Rhizobium mongolense]
MFRGSIHEVMAGNVNADARSASSKRASTTSSTGRAREANSPSRRTERCASISAVPAISVSRAAMKKWPTCASIWRPQDAAGASTTPRRFDSGDVDFSHRHHGLKRPLCFVTASRQRVSQYQVGLASIAKDFGVPQGGGAFPPPDPLSQERLQPQMMMISQQCRDRRLGSS